MEKTLVIAKYKITYSNGVIQELNLIEQSDFANVIKPLLYDIERMEAAKADVTDLEKRLRTLTGGQYFTTESPIFKAKDTGILSIPDLIDKPCKVELIA